MGDKNPNIRPTYIPIIKRMKYNKLRKKCYKLELLQLMLGFFSSLVILLNEKDVK